MERARSVNALYLEITDNPEADIVVTGGVEVTHEAGDIYNDEGAYWTHTLDGNGTIGANGSVDEGVPGEYVLSYQLTDSLGKSYLLSRKVNVVDTTPPVITLNGDANITIEAGSAYVEAGAKWTDIVDGNGTLVGVGQVNYLVPGEYRLVFNYTDQAGNTAQTILRPGKCGGYHPTSHHFEWRCQYHDRGGQCLCGRRCQMDRHRRWEWHSGLQGR